MKVKLLYMSKSIGLAVIRLCVQLPEGMVIEIISRQLIRCGTSIGANYRAALRAKSHADFIYKLKVVEEEADETLFWLELLGETNPECLSLIQPIQADTGELLALIVSSLKTLKKRKGPKPLSS